MTDQAWKADEPQTPPTDSANKPEAWKEYKRDKAIRFVLLGYSVQWAPDISNHMEVYTPQRDDAAQPGMRASVLFAADPSRVGINGGRILKLHMQIRQVGRDFRGRPIVSWETVYYYDNGPDVNKLGEHPLAQKLFAAVIAELN